MNNPFANHALKILGYACISLLISSAQAPASDIKDTLESEHLAAMEKLDAAFKKLSASLPEKKTSIWNNIHRDWLKLSTMENQQRAEITGGGGSAYSTDFMQFQIEAMAAREAYYQEISAQFKEAGVN